MKGEWIRQTKKIKKERIANSEFKPASKARKEDWMNSEWILMKETEQPNWMIDETKPASIQ